MLDQNGIDFAAIELLKASAIQIQKREIQTNCDQLQILNFPSESIGFFGVFDVLEHMGNPGQLLAEMYRTLGRGGYQLVTTPCDRWLGDGQLQD